MHTPRAYRFCDGLTEAVLYFMVILAPWAYGTTEPWWIWRMNVAGYLLGALLLTKWLIRSRTGFRPDGLDDKDKGRRLSAAADGSQGGTAEPSPKERSRTKPLTVTLAALTVALLAFCLVSALNARSTFYYRLRAFEPHESIAWLPRSFDRYATWQAFWMYLGLALCFWATRDWLMGKTSRERRESRESNEAALSREPYPIPSRLRRLLWVLCLNGAVLALEATLQRLSGTDKLLWRIRPEFNNYAVLQFGPFAYRSNGAQYLNLIWPVCLGFWWVLREEFKRSGGAKARTGSGPHVLLLPCSVVIAAAPIISTSRGGAIVAALNLVGALIALLVANRRRRWTGRLGAVTIFATALLLAGYLGWPQLKTRLQTILADELSGRFELYKNARQIARDYPLFGTGPGTFAWIYLPYRTHPEATWEAYAHDDWLETRITFGWVGFSMILSMLAVVLARAFVPGGGTRVRGLFVYMLWLSLGGCLVHAKFDFPFQVYSTLALFVQICCVLFCLSRR